MNDELVETFFSEVIVEMFKEKTLSNALTLDQKRKIIDAFDTKVEETETMIKVSILFFVMIVDKINNTLKVEIDIQKAMALQKS